MPLNDKRDPNSWYNSIPTRYQNEMPKPDKFTQTVLAMKEFDVDKLEDNEYTIGRGDIIAKIPKIEHRIYGRKAHKAHVCDHLELEQNVKGAGGLAGLSILRRLHGGRCKVLVSVSAAPTL